MSNFRKVTTRLLFYIPQPPTLTDPNQAHIVQQLYYLLLLGIPIAFTFVLLDSEARAGRASWGGLIAGGAGVGLIGLLFLVRQGYVRFPAISLLLGALTAISLASFHSQGIRNPALMTIPLLLVLSSLLLNSRITTIFAAIIGVIALLLYFDEQSRVLDVQLRNIDGDYVVVVLATIAMTTLILQFTLNQMVQSSQRIRQQADELHQQNQRLAQTQVDLEARTQQLSQRNAELQLEMSERARTEAALRQKQKLESIGLLAGGVAHDFNNLLTGILNQAELALRRLPNETLQEQKTRQHIEKAVQSTQRAADLTRQLLAYAGKTLLHIEPIDVNQLIQANHSLLETVLQHNAQLHVDLQPHLPAIVSDRSQLQQVLMNLVINAAEAITHDQGQIVIKTAAVAHTTAFDPVDFVGVPPAPGDYVCLAVSDNGVGMDQSTVEKIFDPFFSTKKRGHGLGLSVVLGVVQALHGGLQVQSQAGVGSRFCVYLPASQEQPSAHALPNVPVIHRRQDQLVLVIDDEEPVREAVTEMLNSIGYRTTSASNGYEGLAMFQQQQDEIAAILLDITMPGMNGLEVIQHIRALSDSVKVVLSSGYSDAVVPTAILQQPTTTFLAKPYRLEQLYAALVMGATQSAGSV